MLERTVPEVDGQIKSARLTPREGAVRLLVQLWTRKELYSNRADVCRRKSRARRGALPFLVRNVSTLID